VSLTTWHRRLGHNNVREVLGLEKAVLGLKLGDKHNTFCGECATEKSRRQSVPDITSRVTKRPLELVYSDVAGPMETPSKNGSRYAISFVDAFSRHAWVYFMKLKSEAQSKFEEFLADVGRPDTLCFDKESKITLRCDNGGEYCSRCFDDCCRKAGVKREFTSAYTSRAQRGRRAFRAD
jgi:hypothetical protein